MNTLRASLRTHRALLLIVLLYAAAAALLAGGLPSASDTLNVLAGFLVAILTGPVFILCGYTIHVMVVKRPHRLCHYLYHDLRSYLSNERLLHALPAMLLIPVFASSFTVFKAAIPRLHPYTWDASLSAWDIALHGGKAPWERLQPLLGHPLVTGLLNFSYHFWFFLFYAILYWLILDTRRPLLRMQFLLSFALTWIILGSVMAVLFASVGPCYYGHLHASDPYAPLMAYLHDANQHVPVWALQVQEMLWQGYQSKGANGELGISAMPSMHVATAVLMAIMGWKVSRAAGISLTAFAVLILLGSIHLGWHYALDGYVGAAGAALVWQLVGRLLGSQAAAPVMHMATAPCMGKGGLTS
ncbi:phosphatase PAP2 family protein [Janthinobacterium rivuli]|uniref:phosphatase PAP2 family protein n=1 Tax=Janthinobacterium TaxID=29580 RepID=UPI00383A0690